MPYILSIDQGTTGSTANLIEASGRSLARCNQEFRQIFPQPGWVEHDPEEIWASVLKAASECIKLSGVNPAEIAALGITNQRETVVMWDRKTGEPLHNAIVWQCRRTTDFCDKLKRDKKENLIRRKTGLVIDPYFSASKIRWLLDNVPAARRKLKAGDLRVGTIDSFLLWRLSGGRVFATDVSNASRTQLMDIDKGEWDTKLLELFGVPGSILPEIRPSSDVYGYTRGVPGLPDGIPIASLIGDQQSALFGQTCFKAGEAKCTYGTGSFILMNSGPRKIISSQGLLTTVAWQLKGQKQMTYALEGGAFICGAAVQWLRDGMKMFGKSSEVEALARSVPDTGGVEFVPALTGLGAPYWRPSARGAITGLTRGTNQAHIARATLEAMALQNRDILHSMEEDLGRRLRTLRVDGGASNNDLLMQIQADYLNCRIERPQSVETTSLGAAYLAGLAVGVWRNLDAVRSIWQQDRVFGPQITPKQRKLRLESWKKAVEQV